MLKVLQPQATTLAWVHNWRSKVRRWWLTMTNEEQREVFVRASLLAVCAAAATVSLPAISMVQEHKRAEADYRADAMRLAQMEDGGAAVRADMHAPALLDSAWLRTVEYSLERDTNASMSRYAMRDRDGAALNSLISFRPEHLVRAETIEAETRCMAQAVYYESANEPLEGQLAVAEVVSNRMRDHRYPATACEVVYQGATRTTGCQFTFTCDGAMAIKPRGENWARAQRIAAHVMMGQNETRTGGATHYHATYVDPIWSAGLIKTDKIGVHVFYRFPRGAEWASVRQDFSDKVSERRALIADASAESNAAVPVEGLDEDLFEDAPVAEDTTAGATIEVAAAPVQVVTSTRTVVSSAPMYTTVRRVTRVPAAVSVAPPQVDPATAL